MPFDPEKADRLFQTDESTGVDRPEMLPTGFDPLKADNKLFPSSSVARQAVGTSPDAAAQNEIKGKQFGLQPDTVKSKPEDVEAMDLAARINKAPPTLRALMRDVDFTKQSQDDIDNLSWLEKVARGWQRGLLTDDAGEIGYQQWLQFNPERQAELDAVNARIAALTPDGDDSFFIESLESSAEIFAQMMRGINASVPEMVAGAGVGAATAAIYGQAGPQVATPEEVVTVPALAISGAGYGLTTGMAEHSFRIETGHAYSEMLEIVGENGEKLDPQIASYGATAVGVINAALEVAGVLAVTAPVREVFKRYTLNGVKRALADPTTARAVIDFAKRYGTGWAGEVSTEVIQEIVNMEAVEMVKQLSEGDFQEMTEYEWNQRVADIFDKVGKGMLLLALPGPGVTLAQDMSAVRKGRTDAQRLADMSEAAKNSKLRERNPERFRELMKRLGEETGSDAVYVDREAAEVLFQRGIDEEIADQPGVREFVRDTYKAREDGSADVAIPLEVYATEIVGTSLDEALKNDMHMDPDAFTINQLSDFDLQKRIEEISEMDADQLADESYVYNDILGQLIGANEPRSKAEHMARVTEVLFQALAERQGLKAAGETMQSLFDRFGLRVDREVDPAVASRMRAVERLDVLLDKLREGSVPQDQEIFGDSVLKFIADQGGIVDTAGELAAMDVNEGRVGNRLIARDTGLDLDYMAEILEESGYIGERSEAAVLDAIRRELAGEMIYPLGSENVELLGLRDELIETELILDEAGIDITQMTNEEVREAIQAEGAPSDAFYQIRHRQAVKRRNVVNQIRRCISA